MLLPAARPFDRHGVEAPSDAPPVRLRLGEVRTPLQVPRLLARAPWLLRAPRGNGQLVVDLPGWKAGEVSNVAMRTWLRHLGYDAQAWGLGVNTGNPERDAEILIDRFRDRTDRVALVAWSLGGVVAREVARALPEVVSTIVTYGTPIIGGPTFTVGAAAYGPQECERITRLTEERDREDPIQVPITTIFSRRDGVVDWRACIDTASPHVRHVEVRSTHLGLGIDPDVWWTVATTLAAVGGQPRR